MSGVNVSFSGKLDIRYDLSIAALKHSITIVLLCLRNQAALDFCLNAAVAVKLLCAAWF